MPPLVAILQPFASLANNGQMAPLLAASIWLHTMEEVTQVPAYQRALGARTINTRSEVLMDSLPIFLVLPLSAGLSQKWAWIRDTLAVVALLHPILDHVLLAFQRKKIVMRPGTTSALLLALPLGILNYSNRKEFGYRKSLAGAGLGLAISIFLYVAAKAEIDHLLS